MSKTCARRHSDGKEFVIEKKHDNGSVTVIENGEEIILSPGEFTEYPCHGHEGLSGTPKFEEEDDGPSP